MTADLEDAWAELERIVLDERTILGRRFAPEAQVDLFIGVDKPTNVRLMFVEAPVALIPDAAELPQSSGFSVEVEQSPRDDASRMLVVRLSRGQFRDVFTAFVADVLDVARRARDPADACAKIVGRVAKWQAFVSRHGSEGLSILEQRGLYAELWFLRKHALPWCGGETAVSAWTGPLAKDQDFQFTQCSVEVKSSAANPDQRVHINNVRQLGDGPLPLFLLHLAFEERHEQGETLVAIVRQLRERLPDTAALMFESRLSDAGYLEVHANRYTSTGYVVKSAQFFEVAAGFPRILERELRPGVGDVKYTIALGACAPFATPVDRLRAMLETGQ